MGYGRFNYDFPPDSGCQQTSALFISFPLAASARRRFDLAKANA
jgi:hypothetical protein